MTKILVIEDEASLRDDLVELLDAEGFEAVGAEDGQMGVELAQKILPDLIICDIMLPKLDGHGVLSLLRNDTVTSLIPFIFLTARGTVDDFRQGMNLGADDYLTKPWRQADLMQAIATRLGKQAAVLQLQQKVEALEYSNVLKDGFLNTASCELRSPITNMMLSIQMIRNAPTRERQQLYIELLETECSREINLINDLLELQQLETHSRPLRLEPLNLQEWISVIAEPFYKRIQQRQQTLQINIPPYIPSLVLDCVSLKRILGELLNNACKYTAPKGKIVLDVYRSPQVTGADSNPVLMTTFVVSNQAEIPKEAIPCLFDKFYRVPGGDRWNQGGSGLGLPLVKQLVEQLEGNIQVISESHWTQVLIHLPAQAA
jgi:two-component system, sensor histidine kinase and response regulator